MIAVLVAFLVPWLVKVIMETTQDSERFGWIYRAISLNRRGENKGPPNGMPDRRSAGAPAEEDPADTYFGGK